MNHGKHYVDSKKLVDRTKLYDTEEALALCCQTAKAKFDETVELHVRLGVDSRHADQQVRGAVVLPNGTGKDVRVIAIAKGDAAKAAEEAGSHRQGEARRGERPVYQERYRGVHDGPRHQAEQRKIRRLSCKLKKRAPADFQHRQQNARERAALATRPARIFRRIYAEKRGTVLCE